MLQTGNFENSEIYIMQVGLFMEIQKTGITLAEQLAKHGLDVWNVRVVPYAKGYNLEKDIFVPKETNRFSITDNEFCLLSPAGDRLSSIIYFKNNDYMDIFDMSSTKSGCGYGTILMQKFIDSFKNCKIKLAACWERLISAKPPHKFYMQNGFVPADKKAEQALKEWVAKGANPEDFPIEYELCEMVRLPNKQCG